METRYIPTETCRNTMETSRYIMKLAQRNENKLQHNKISKPQWKQVTTQHNWHKTMETSRNYSIQDYLYSTFYDTFFAKQLYRKLSFYYRFIYCRNLIYFIYNTMETSHNTTKLAQHNENKLQHNGIKSQHNEIGTTQWKQATSQQKQATSQQKQVATQQKQVAT